MTASLHEQDFYGWVQAQAQLLKAGNFHDLDLHNLIDEVESMGASERRELMSRLEVLLAHLLKWQYQPGRRCSSWLNTIEEQRVRISDHLQANPSLANPELLTEAFSQSLPLCRAVCQASDRPCGKHFSGSVSI
jgi:hypothetical protein